jgi:hypothetical protein
MEAIDIFEITNRFYCYLGVTSSFKVVKRSTLLVHVHHSMNGVDDFYALWSLPDVLFIGQKSHHCFLLFLSSKIFFLRSINVGMNATVLKSPPGQRNADLVPLLVLPYHDHSWAILLNYGLQCDLSPSFVSVYRRSSWLK